MQIGELAALTRVSARALRHYEDCGLLIPDRTSRGYRRYSGSDINRVLQIKMMISAGLGTATIKRYLDCAREGDHGTFLQMCPNLRAELEALADGLSAKAAELRETQQRLRQLTSLS